MALTKVSRGLLSTSIEDNGNATAITIDSLENVGIGTSSPVNTLSIKGSVNQLDIETSTAGVTLESIDRSDLNAQSDLSYYARHGNHKFFNSAYTQAMTIDSSGNVLVGKTSADYNDSSRGNVEIEGSASAILSLTGNNTNGYLFQNGVNMSLWNGGSGYLRFGSSNTERMRIDSSGNLNIGTTGDVTSTNAGIQLRADNTIRVAKSGLAAMSIYRHTNNGSIISFYRDATNVGAIGGQASGTLFIAGSSSQNTGVRFFNTGVAPCNSSGDYVDNSRDLGSSTVRWDDVYATNGTIQTSDRNEKQDIAELSEAEQRVAVAARGLLRKFRWKDSVAEKGDDARIHFGIIAQDLQAAFEAEGLDAGDYAMFISSTWTDEETNEEKTRMGVRYSELLAFIISAI